MWVLRVYEPDHDEPVAEHELADVDWDDLRRILGFAPSAYVSTSLDHEALRNLDLSLEQLRQPGRESWKDREVFLDFDADPAREQQAEPSWRADAALS